jgi:hypothetical protein
VIEAMALGRNARQMVVDNFAFERVLGLEQAMLGELAAP